MAKHPKHRLIATVASLQTRGYDLDFCPVGNQLYCPQVGGFLKPSDCRIVETHRFNSKVPQRSTIVYGIEAPDSCLKGILLTRSSGSPAFVGS